MEKKCSPTDDENEPFTQQKELRNSAEFCEAITPPLQDLSTAEQHKEPGNKPTGTKIQC